MEVTRANFREILPELEKNINDCVFIAIDTEFTGLTSGLEKAIYPFDSQAEYYCKLKKGSLDFLMVQFGLVAFMYNNEEKKYTYKAYNFYVFPKPFSRKAPDCRFLCQASSIDFLASHGFDFNKVFYEGISYLNKKDELLARAKVDEERERRSSLGEKNDSFVKCPPEHEKNVKKAFNSIIEFLSKDDGPDELTLPQTSSFVRKLVYQEVWKKFTPDDLRIETKNFTIVVRRPATNKEKEEEEKKKRSEEEAGIEEAIGFSKVIRLISQSRKLVVGHNMLLDLCHIIHRFCEPLPESYEEFKEVLHCVFPYILDTKFMCAVQPLRDEIESSVLGNLLATVSKGAPFYIPTIISEEQRYSLTKEKEHEAVYDAYITGKIAIALSNYLVKHKKLKLCPVSRLPSATSPHLADVINRLFLMKVTNNCHIDLVNDDPKPNRDAVFHITFPEEWKATDLNNMFSPFGGVQVTWVSSTSAFCSLYDHSQVMNVTQKLLPATPPRVEIITYHAFNNLTQTSPLHQQSKDPTAAALSTCAVLKRKHSVDNEESLKKLSVTSIHKEPEEEEIPAQPERNQKKKRRIDSKNRPHEEEEGPKLFEESLEW